MASKENPADPLREPRDARARLRQKRQSEAAAKYNATYDQRVAGGILASRPTAHPVAGYAVQAHADAMADGAVVMPAAMGRPSTTGAAAATPAAQGWFGGDAPAVRSSSSGGPAAARPHMEGRLVNIYGQTLDRNVPAIQQIVNGAFYTARGNCLSELGPKKEGKFMRFRAGPVEEPPSKDAFTMTATRWPVTSASTIGSASALPSGNAAAQRPLGAGLLGRSHRDAAAGVVGKRPQSCDVSVDATSSNNANTASSDLDKMIAAAHAKIAAQNKNAQSSEGAKKTPRSFMKPTHSHTKKMEEKEKELRKQQAAKAAASMAPAPVSARGPPKKTMFETALEKQKQHRPGEAAVLDERELQRILQIANSTDFIVERPQTARPTGQFTGFS